MTTSVRIAAGSSGPVALPSAAADRARSTGTASSAEPPDNFHAMLEQHSGSEAKPQARAARPQTRSAQTREKSAPPKSSAPSKTAKDSDTADQSKAMNDTASVEAPPAQASLVPRPSGPIDLSANLPSNGPTDTTNETDLAESFSSSATGAQGDPGALSVAVSLPQRSTAALISSAMAASAFKRAGSSTGANAASVSSGVLPLNLQAAPMPGNAEEPAGVPSSNLDNPAQSVSAQSGNPAGHGLDSNELRAEVSTKAAASSDPIAFEAKLTPSQGSSPAAGNTTQTAPAQSVAQAADQSGSKALSTPSAAEASAPLPAAAPRTETLFAIGATPGSAPAPSPASHVATHGAAMPDATPAAERMQPLIEAPAPLGGTGHSIVVKVPGADGSSGIDLRFVERAGDIHLSVRTPSADVAQELRGGLGDLVGRLNHAGIRTEVTSLIANQSTSADSSPKQSQDQNQPDRRGFSQNSGDSQSQQQEPRGSSRSRWMAAFAESNQFSQEHMS